MTERKKNLLALSALLAILVLFFWKILFTHQIIRAPDIINEFYWGVLDTKLRGTAALFRFDEIRASWNQIINSGHTNEGGMSSIHFLFYQPFILLFFPAPANVGWFIVLHLFLGAAGVYAYCRAIGASLSAALLGAAIFALAPENASLINAGHVMKIATISFAPWAFYFFERGFQTRKVVFFLATGFFLAIQFFNTHWQVAYYTCLGIGVYGVVRSVGILLEERKQGKSGLARLVGLNLVTMFFFLSTVAISLVPLANWSKGTNRGVESGASQGKGGLAREEAMSWSLPPEETAAFIVPGFFGYSRQEAGANPSNIDSFYWGRMNFTQTLSYMGLLPWLLLPLPIIFRRNRYTILAIIAVVGGVLFSMGKYTPFYNFLYDYFPGINHFRVPKMIMFLPVMGLGVLSAMGLDILRDPELRARPVFRRYLMGLALLPVALLTLLGAELLGKEYWIGRFYEMLSQPTRYEQGPQMLMQRWNNLVAETAIAAGLSALIAGAVGAYYRKWLPVRVLPAILFALLILDVGRVDSKFIFMVDVPEKVKGSQAAKDPVLQFLGRQSGQYRVLPMGGDPMFYASNNIPVMFTSNPVQQVRWQEFLDSFTLNSAMPDMLNVKYLVYGREQYEKEKTQLLQKYAPAFSSPDGGTIVLENRTVLPKAWLVPSAVQAGSPQQVLGVLQNPNFDPRLLALVEAPPPIPMDPPDMPPSGTTGAVRVVRYEGERIELEAQVAKNAMMVLGEKYYQGWRATVDGKKSEIYPVDHILRGVYLTPGIHKVEFVFDPLAFKIGKYLTLASFAFFFLMLCREMRLRRGKPPVAKAGAEA